MKQLDWSYELHVFGTRPKTLPFVEFAELAKRFADLLGCPDKVHFGALRTGSARLLVRVEEAGQRDVTIRIMEARSQGRDSRKVIGIDDYLRLRGWRGEVRDRAGNVVLSLPGVLGAKAPEEERTVEQRDTLVGQVIKIGGRDETVPMTLETVDGIYVVVTVMGRDLAKRLAQHLFGKEIRISGLATWKRCSEGTWSCAGMLVDHFDEPDGTPLVSLFDTLREIPGNGWNAIDDPISQWMKLRSDN